MNEIYFFILLVNIAPTNTTGGHLHHHHHGPGPEQRDPPHQTRPDQTAPQEISRSIGPQVSLSISPVDTAASLDYHRARSGGEFVHLQSV